MAEPKLFTMQKLHATKAGREVLDGKQDAFDLMKRDNWLGGVHNKSGESLWTWDAGRLTLQQRAK